MGVATLIPVGLVFLIMQTVRDEEGTEYLLVKQSGDSSRVRDPESGTEQYLPNDRLTSVAGTSPLETAAASVPSATRRVMTAARDTQSLGLLVEVVDRGPLSVIALLDAYDLCESELHGLVGEFRAAGLLEETRVHGRRGYDATPLAREAVAEMQSGSSVQPSAETRDDDHHQREDESESATEKRTGRVTEPGSSDS